MPVRSFFGPSPQWNLKTPALDPRIERFAAPCLPRVACSHAEVEKFHSVLGLPALEHTESVIVEPFPSILWQPPIKIGLNFYNQEMVCLEHMRHQRLSDIGGCRERADEPKVGYP